MLGSFYHFPVCHFLALISINSQDNTTTTQRGKEIARDAGVPNVCLQMYKFSLGIASLQIPSGGHEAIKVIHEVYRQLSARQVRKREKERM